MECNVKISTILLLLILTVPQEGTSHPDGAPIEACSTLMPQHRGTAPQSSKTIPYQLDTDGDTYTPGGTVRVRLLVTEDPRYVFFRGFILQARRRDDGTPFGSWQVPPTDVIFWRHLLCPDTDYIEATITHTDNAAKYPPPPPDNFITWTAPELVQSNPETVDFVASVVYNFTTYWVNLQKSVTLGNTSGNVSVCESNPCLNAGTCLTSVSLTSYSCRCQASFTGTNCEILSDTVSVCQSSPCLNEGRCFRSGDLTSYICQCQAQFTGTHCENVSDEVPVICDSYPCQNQGLCSSFGTSYSCQCQVPFTGTNCEIYTNVCASEPCFNGGICMDSVITFRCHCPAGFTGTLCDTVSICDTFPCLNGGMCLSSGTSYACFCQVPFTGTNCAVYTNVCASEPCFNGGICIESLDTFQCECTAELTGTLCETDAVPPTVLCPEDLIHKIDVETRSIFLNWTAPTVFDNFGQVHLVSRSQDPGLFLTGMYTVEYVYRDDDDNRESCSFEIVVEQVDFTPCQPNPCENGGTCRNASEPYQFVCQCAEDYSGKRCSVTPCTSKPCLNGGSCSFEQNIIHCLCDSAFYGRSCEVDPCASNPCNNSGSCEHFGSEIRCFCADGFIGTSCDVDLEHPKLLYCPENIVACITSATAETLSVTWAEPIGEDNSQSVSVILDSPKGPGSNFSLGSTSMIRYFITDPSYNAVECLFNVTVEDKAPPIITYCPANITQQVTSVTQQGLFITWNLPEAFDLSNQNVTIVPANESQPMPGSFFSVRSTSVIQYNISDVLNNTAFCSFTVTVHLCVCYTNATMQAEGNLCIIDNSCSIDAILQDISEVPVDEENVEQIAAVLANATGYYDRIQTNGVGSIGSTMESIAAVGSPSVQVTEMVIETVDNILNVAAESFASNQSASAMILQAFESQLTNPRDDISLTRENIIVLVVNSSPQSDSESLGFATIPEDGNIDETLLNNNEKLFIGDDKIPVVEAEASILIPEEAFTPGIANSSANFVVYQNAKLFQVAQVKGLYVDGRVISGTLSGQDKRVTNLTNPVVTSFRPLNNTSTADRICVFWDPTLVAGNSVGSWSTKGCRLAEDRGVGEAKVCHCDHLTNFAILISHGGDPMDLVLDILSKIGCGISIAALILTILTTLTSSDLSSVPQKTLLNLCVSLILLYGVFLVGIELIQPRVACIIFAALIHYFFLSSVCWSSAEASICFYLLVLTRRNLVGGYLLRMMIFCWGVPALIVFVSLAVPYFGSGQWNVPEGKYCFLSPGNPIYFGVLLPVGALLLFNIFIYILVFRRLVCQRVESTLTRQETRAKLVLRQARTMIPISILLGGTWIFGFLAIDIFSVTFQYIFAILNSLIGLAVFIFFVLMRKKGRQGLRNLLCCRSKDSMGSSGARGSHSTSDTRLRNSGNINSNTT